VSAIREYRWSGCDYESHLEVFEEMLIELDEAKNAREVLLFSSHSLRIAPTPSSAQKMVVACVLETSLGPVCSVSLHSSNWFFHSNPTSSCSLLSSNDLTNQCTIPPNAACRSPSSCIEITHRKHVGISKSYARGVTTVVRLTPFPTQLLFKTRQADGGGYFAQERSFIELFRIL